MKSSGMGLSVLMALQLGWPVHAAHPEHDHGSASETEADKESEIKDEVEVGVGSVNVISRPEAEIIIDGKRLGRTPLALKLPHGEHSLRLKPAKGPSQTIDFRVTEGQSPRLCWDFDAKASCAVATPPSGEISTHSWSSDIDESLTTDGVGRLRLNSTPRSQVDWGTEPVAPVGPMPVLKEMPAGSHSVVLRTADGRQQRIEFRVGKDQLTNICWDFDSEGPCAR